MAADAEDGREEVGVAAAAVAVEGFPLARVADGGAVEEGAVAGADAGAWFRAVVARGVLLAGAEGGFEVLADEGWRAAGAGLDVALLLGVGRQIAGGGIVWRGCDGGLVWGEDEGGALRDDFGEACGALPAAGEGADAVDATDVGEGRETVGY